MDEPVLMPDGLDGVLEVDAMLAVFAARRFERVEAFRRDALRETEVFRGAAVEIIERSVRMELAAAMRISEHLAERLLVQADALVNRYPEMLDALGRTRTTERHAAVLVDELDGVEEDVRAAVLTDAVAWAQELPVTSFRRQLRTAVERMRALSLENRHREALAARRVVVEKADDGMAWLSVHLPAVEAYAAFDRITRIARELRTVEGEERGLDQLRSDLAADLLIDGHADAHPASAHGIRPTVVVTVPVLSLLDDDAVASTGPAVMEGVGPIPIERARELCGGAGEWMRVLTHPETGMVLSVGRETYRTPAPLRRLATWRSGHCMAPTGCGMPADRCDIDHTRPWKDGGHTALANHAPLCRGHHTVRHHGGWKVAQHPDGTGTIEWTSPTGRSYVVRPEKTVPAFSPDPPPAPDPAPPPF